MLETDSQNHPILGIDPGSRVTGYGIIRANPNQKHTYLTSGFIAIEKEELGGKLKKIHTTLTELIQTYCPVEAAFEQVFFHENPGTALKLGQARGTAIAAAAIHDLSIHEYTARQVKKAVVGTGTAQKEQVQHMVKLLLNLNALPQVDEADALAIALCHAYTRQGLLALGAGQLKMRRGRLR